MSKITENDLEPGTIFKGFENCHHGTYKDDLIVLSSVEHSDYNRDKFGGPLYCFIALPRSTGNGFGGGDRPIELTLEECLNDFGNFERVGTLEEAFEKMGWRHNQRNK